MRSAHCGGSGPGRSKPFPKVTACLQTLTRGGSEQGVNGGGAGKLCVLGPKLRILGQGGQKQGAAADETVHFAHKTAQLTQLQPPCARLTPPYGDTARGRDLSTSALRVTLDTEGLIYLT